MLRSGSLSIKHQAIKIHLDAQPGLLMNSYPGATAQIVTKLLQNTVLHAFADKREGNVHILVKAAGETGASLEISDNGCGMDAHTAKMARNHTKALIRSAETPTNFEHSGGLPLGHSTFEPNMAFAVPWVDQATQLSPGS